jgi:hypothetical protein
MRSRLVFVPVLSEAPIALEDLTKQGRACTNHNTPQAYQRCSNGGVNYTRDCMLNKFSKYLIIVSLALIVFGCGSGSPTPPVVQPSLIVYQYGDSITRQAGTILLDYLPAGSTANNMGLDGQKASDATNGRYGSMPVLEQGKVYTFSWGVNEALNGFTDSEYELPMNHVFNACKGFKCVIEAPWLMVNPQNNAPEAVVRYRAILKRLGVQYNIPVIFEDSQEHIGDGIHPNEAHARIRAKLLADAILKL